MQPRREPHTKYVREAEAQATTQGLVGSLGMLLRNRRGQHLRRGTESFTLDKRRQTLE